MGYAARGCCYWQRELGADTADNMQWQTVAAAHAKDW
jgi:hypothetical protein